MALLGALGEVGLHLGLDQRLGQRNLDRLEQLGQDLVAGLGALLELLGALGLRGHVGAQLVHRVELRRQLGELVVQLGELALLDGQDRDGDLGVLAGAVATREGGGERLGLVGLDADQLVVHALEHVAGADLVGDARDRVDLLAVDARRQVDRHEVAGPGGAVDAHEAAEALLQLRQVGVDVLVGHLDVVDVHGDAREVRHLDRGADVHLSGEGQLLAVLEGDLGDVDLGLRERLEAGLVDGLAVELRERLVDGLLQDGALADALVDDAGGDLAATETGNLHLLADGLVRRVDARLELLEGDLDGQLDPGRAEVLDGTLHCGCSKVCARGLGALVGARPPRLGGVWGGGRRHRQGASAEPRLSTCYRLAPPIPNGRPGSGPARSCWTYDGGARARARSGRFGQARSTVKSQPVLSRISSSVTPSNSSRRTRPSAVTSKTHRSVMIRWTTALPV